MILLGLVAVLWVLVLAPSVWRRFGERQGVGSIDSFHHQLQLLEHAGPKSVAPAYRLHTALPGAAPGPEATSMTDASRPKLVLLRPTEDAAAADVDDDDGCHYERVGVLDRPEPLCLPEAGADLRALRRELARRRFNILLRCLGGVAVSTFIIGLWPGMHLAWVFTALTGLPALSLLGLMAYANQVKEEQRRRGSWRAAAVVDGVEHKGGVEYIDSLEYIDGVEYIDPATAGYPGAWDDDEPFEEPRAAAR